MAEPVGAMDVPHMPYRCAKILRHADAVAGIVACGGVEHRVCFEKLCFHVGIAFEAAGGNDHAAPCGDMVFLAVLQHGDADDFASRRIGDQALRANAQADVDARSNDVVVHHLKEFRAVGRAIGPRIVLTRIKAGHIDDGRVIEGVGAGQRIVAADLPTVRITGFLSLLVFFD